ncbi:hypothetical protein EGI32_15530 [Ferruginibacter sp. HRS2-29]|nr:hypothetical protein [Ferruginibacter sp. HRS2-29]
MLITDTPSETGRIFFATNFANYTNWFIRLQKSISLRFNLYCLLVTRAKETFALAICVNISPPFGFQQNPLARKQFHH